ncbi:hypothetical protein H0H81_009055 [Sphagnurus paluster]|uniref:Uncharacterized protein n=1 Tax=Sphagnurus paluster TaxID=117069 RepID=A0A9P7FTT3_9AGAR|nr:hypothetical protein H0H81_009055 [Sphagnurus paluster]
MDLTLGGPASATNSHYFNQTSNNDTTPASEVPLLRGGALLRGLRRISDNKVISGPSLLVDEILRLSHAVSISELVAQKWANNTSAFQARPLSLFLRPRSALASPPPTVYASPRIGLDLSHPGTTTSPDHPRVVFLPRLYRYFTHPELLTANGRTQTFLGVLRTCRSTTCKGQDLGDVRLRKEVMRITGLNEATVSRYIENYKGGVDSGRLKAFVGVQGKGASSSPPTYLRMMGALERLRLEAQ